VESATLHDRQQSRLVLQDAQVLERVAIDEQQVRQVAGCGSTY
jgi:hypothetical protein